jgi:glycosyltransferase involved in cell wall biosynthesis
MTEWRPRRPGAGIFVSGSFSGINRHFVGALAREFPELAFYVFDLGVLGGLIPRRPGPLLRAAAEVTIDFRRYLMRRPDSLRACFARTGTALGARRALARRLAQRYGPFVFTLQTQTLLDAKVPGAPHFVYTDHAGRVTATYPGHGPGQLWPEPWLSREEAILRSAEVVFAMGEHVAAELKGSYRLPSVECVHGGPNVAPDGVEPERPVPGYAPARILFVGRRWEPKGGPLLLEAFARVREQVQDARLVIAGCSPRAPQAGVDVMGRIPPGDMPGLYRAASIFCLPTRAEPMGIAFLEAMAFRLPLVGPRLGAIPYFLRDGETGFTYAPGDAGELARRLLVLARDPGLCKSFGDAGHDLGRREYTWEAVAARVASVIRERLAAA